MHATLLEPKTFGGDDQGRIAIEYGAGAVVEAQTGAAVGVGDQLVVERHAAQPLHALATDRDPGVDWLEIRQRGGQGAGGCLMKRATHEHEAPGDRE